MKRRKYLLLLLFFFSGAAGLIYEVVWARQLGLVFGTAIYAVSTVIAFFFTGLALGSYWLGKLADRIKKPLRLYGFLEVVIGLYALATPFLFKLIEGWQAGLGLNLNFFTWSALRFFLSVLVLIVPTTLIGGTLPAMIKHFSIKQRSFGKVTAVLYGLNTLGAALGAVLAGFVLIPGVGIRNTLWLAALTSALVGAISIAVSSNIKGVVIAKAERFQERSMSIDLIFWAFFLSGLAAIALEVLWTRMLILVIGVSVYAFAVILATFLLGIALGSLIVNRFIHKINPLKTFSLLEFFRGILVILLIPVFGRLPFWYLQMIKSFGWSFEAGMRASIGLTGLILLPPTILMGMTFPVVTKIVAKKYKNLGTVVGKAYLFNTLGGVIGSLLAGFFLVPLIGIQKSMVLIAGIYFAVSWAISRKKEIVMVVGATILAIGFFLPNWNERILGSGLYGFGRIFLKSSQQEFEGFFENRKLLYSQEGVSALIGVVDDGFQRILLVNGKSQSGSVSDIQPQLMLGHLPMLLQENPKNALVIGLGTGMTLGAMEQYDEMENVVAVEIEPEIVEAAEYFSGVNNNALADPRLEIVVEDGRNYLLTTNKRFDVISSQPSNPWIKGMANLYTKEFFELAKSRLTDDGVMVQWVQINALTDEDLKSFVATFQSVFPEVSIWETIYSVYLVGSKNRLEEIDFGRLGLINSDVKVRRDLLRMGVDSPTTFIGHFVAGGGAIGQWTEGAKLHTDDRPFLEFNTPKSFYEHEETLAENLRVISDLRTMALTGMASEREYIFRGNLIKAEMAFAEDDLYKAKKYFEEAARLKPGSVEAREGLNYVNFLLRN